MEARTAFAIQITFSKSLKFFLPKSQRGETITKRLREKTSVKDVIESCGVPHPEVNRILCDGCEVGFDYQLTTAARLEIRNGSCGS